MGLGSFIKQGQRAEIFELTDNEIPVFRISIPVQEEYIKFRKVAKTNKKYSPEEAEENNNGENELLLNYEDEIKNSILLLQKCNFTEKYPNFDSNEFPELNISDKGYSHINLEKVLKGFKLNRGYYPDTTRSYRDYDLRLKVMSSNENFNLLNILITLAKLTPFDEIVKYDKFTYNLVKYKFVHKNNDNYNLDNSSYRSFLKTIKRETTIQEKHIDRIFNDLENIQENLKRILNLLKEYNFSTKPDFKVNFPEMKINDHGLPEYDVNEIMNEFDLNLEEYIHLNTDYQFSDIYLSILQSNQTFNLLNILISLANVTEFNSYVSDDELTRRLIFYKFIHKNDNGMYSFDMESMVTSIKNYYNEEVDINYTFKYDKSQSKYSLNNINDYTYQENAQWISDTLSDLRTETHTLLFYLRKYNFMEHGLMSMKDEFPELKIGDDGLPAFFIPEIYDGFKYNYSDYPYLTNPKGCDLLVFHSNKDFRLLDILMAIAKRLDFDYEEHDEFTFKLLSFKFVFINDQNNYEIDNESYKSYFNIWRSDEKTYKDFKTKNATMSVEINGEEKQFKKITFSIGGHYSRSFSKPQYNIKIRGGNDLYGRRQFKLRSDSEDPSLLRTKLISDIHNRLELPSVSANYATLFINDEYMGLYIMTDTYKLSWVEYNYGEKDTTSLYKCNESNLSKTSSKCENENEDVTDLSEWNAFIETLDNAQSASDLENIFDIDQFLNEMALEFLFNGFDHFQFGHNYYMFKPKDGKWLYLSYDFDLDFGDIRYKPDIGISEFFKPFHITDILIKNDPSRFDTILKDIVTKVFNPATLYPYINELKDFIRHYVDLDKVVGSLGYAPGRINDRIDDSFTLEDWESNSEFTFVQRYGLKYFILEKYRFICNYYNMECDPTYMDSNFKY